MSDTMQGDGGRVTYPALMKRERCARSLLTIVLALTSLLVSGAPALSSAWLATRPPLTLSGTSSSVAPVFEANRGQAGPDVLYLARASHVLVMLTRHGVRLAAVPPRSGVSGALPLQREGVAARGESLARASSAGAVHRVVAEEAAISLTPVGMSARERVVPQTRLPGIVNYFIGNNPARWRANVPTYAAILYRDVYPGISLRFHAGWRGLEYDWLLQPGADPGRIRLRVSGASLHRNSDGSLTLGAGAVALREGAPQTYSGSAMARHSVRSSYTLVNGHEIGFSVGPHASNAPLVIDPTLVYATYLGGGGDEGGYALTVDAQGNAYITGDTQSTDFPLAGPTQGSLRSDSSCTNPTAHLVDCPDAFVSKISADGHTLLYSTYLGGSFDDYGHGVAVDSAGNAYVTGNTISPDFPVVAALMPHFGGGQILGDSYITKLNPRGNAILFSTFLGGTGDDDGEGIVESAGSIYLTGTTNSPDFPAVHAWQRAPGGGTCTDASPTSSLNSPTCSDAFVAKLPDTGANLTYSTYLGGNRQETATSIAVRNGSAYVTGSTASTDFPAVHPLHGYAGGTCGTEAQPYPCEDGYLSVLAPDGSGALLSTYVGGSADDIVNHVAVGAQGTIYLVGTTRSSDFPLVHALKATLAQDDEDAFVTAIDGAGTKVQFSTYLGGTESDDAYGVAVDDVGDVFVTGSTLSPDFPMRDPMQSAIQTVPDATGEPASVQTAYVSALKPDGSDLLYSTYLGDSGNQNGSDPAPTLGADIAVDGEDNVYVTGFTKSDGFPVTSGALQTAFGGIFVAKIHQAVPRPPTPTPQPTSTPAPIPTRTAAPTRTPTRKAKKCKKGYKVVHGKCKKIKKGLSDL